MDQYNIIRKTYQYRVPPLYRQIRLYSFLACLTSLWLVLPCSADSGDDSNSVQIGHLTTPKTAATALADAGGIDEEMLGLEDLIRIALKNNKMIEVSRQRLAQSQGRLTQARAGYLPQLAVEGRYSYMEQRDSASSGRGESANLVNGEEISSFDETEEDDVVHGAARFSQLLYDFGKTTGAIGTGKSNLKAADAHLLRQIQDILFQVKTAYYNVLEKRRLVDVAAESVKSFEQQLARAKAYLKAGVRTKIDVINAEVELSTASMNLLRAKYDVKTARVALELVLGTTPNQGRYALYSDEVHLDTVLESMPPVPASLDTLTEVALEQRPDILQFKERTEAAEANLTRVKGDYWPTISAEASYNEYDTDLSLFKDRWEVGVACTWELFSGRETEGAVAEAHAQLLENKAELQHLQLTVTSEVTDSYLRADENRQSVQIALQTLELARENLLLAEKRYLTGAYDVIEFNDAQLSLTKAQSELVVTYYGYLTAVAGIEYAIGGQLEAL